LINGVQTDKLAYQICFNYNPSVSALGFFYVINNITAKEELPMSKAYDKDPNKKQRWIDEGKSKQCSKCKQELLISDYYWIKTSNQPMCQCKECWKANRRKSWNEDPLTKETRQKWVEENREEINEYRKQRYHDKPEVRAKISEWQKENRERRNAQAKERYYKKKVDK